MFGITANALYFMNFCTLVCVAIGSLIINNEAYSGWVTLLGIIFLVAGVLCNFILVHDGYYGMLSDEEENDEEDDER